MAKPVTCTTVDECDEHDDEEVRVVGVYRKYEMGAGKGRTWRGHVIIDLGGGGPLLGRYWHDESKRADDEIARFEGKPVAVIGRYRSVTPPNPKDPPHAARLTVPMLVDIVAIEPASDEEAAAASGSGGDGRPDPKTLPPL